MDSLKHVKKLEEADVKREQAEATVEVMSDIVRMSDLATRDDLLTTRVELKRDLSAVREDFTRLERRFDGCVKELRDEIKLSEYRMTIRMYTIIPATFGAILLLAKILTQFKII